MHVGHVHPEPSRDFKLPTYQDCVNDLLEAARLKRRPNLQNVPIPITPEGQALRDLFLPKGGMHFLTADYTAVELRCIEEYLRMKRGN